MKDQLAFRIKVGDEQAFELLFRKMYVRLCCYANKFLNDPEETKEIVQDVFSALWENREGLNSDCPVEAYLYKITRNSSISRLRRRKSENAYTEITRLVYVDHNDESPVYEELCVHELERKLAMALEKMPDGCRRVYDLSRNEGLKYSEIAKSLNISVKTVEAQMSKAFRILRVELAEYIALLFFIFLN